MLNNIWWIGQEAFRGCLNLTTFEIPSSVTNIGRYAFASCKNLVTIKISNNVKKIGDYCFNWCSNLTDIIFENTTGWNMTSSSSYANGTVIDVTNSVTNATNLKSTSGSWCNKYLYRV